MKHNSLWYCCDIIVINWHLHAHAVFIHFLTLFVNYCNFSLNKTKEAMDFWLRGLEYVVTNYKTQNGTRRFPARSCRDLQIDYPEYTSGKSSLNIDFYRTISSRHVAKRNDFSTRRMVLYKSTWHSLFRQVVPWPLEGILDVVHVSLILAIDLIFPQST